MADILQMTFQHISFTEKFCILIEVSLKFVLWVLIENKSVMVQVMAWHQTGDKPLPEPMFTKFSGHMASPGHIELTLYLLNGFDQT